VQGTEAEAAANELRNTNTRHTQTHSLTRTQCHIIRTHSEEEIQAHTLMLTIVMSVCQWASKG